MRCINIGGIDLNTCARDAPSVDPSHECRRGECAAPPPHPIISFGGTAQVVADDGGGNVDRHRVRAGTGGRLGRGMLLASPFRGGGFHGEARLKSSAPRAATMGTMLPPALLIFSLAAMHNLTNVAQCRRWERKVIRSRASVRGRPWCTYPRRDDPLLARYDHTPPLVPPRYPFAKSVFSFPG